MNPEDQKEVVHKIFLLENSINQLKNALIRQNKLILDLTTRYIKLNSEITSNKPNLPSSTSNKGVNQSINNQSTITKHYQTKKPIYPPYLREIERSTGNEGVQEVLALTKHIQQNKADFADFKEFKTKLNDSFKKLSRQELNTFLTIYNLEDENLNPTYKAIAEKMSLSEHCIRAHVCSILKKGVPLEKSKLNNRLTLLFVKKDFKILNLKQKILEIYYKTDPNQTTLF